MAERDDEGRKRARWSPWLLLGPGLVFLFLFFFFPLYTLFRMSLSASPTRFSDPVFGWEWGNYSTAFSDYGDQFVRSFEYAALATLLALVIAYPLAYVIMWTICPPVNASKQWTERLVACGHIVRSDYRCYINSH